MPGNLVTVLDVRKHFMGNKVCARDICFSICAQVLGQCILIHQNKYPGLCMLKRKSIVLIDANT